MLKLKTETSISMEIGQKLKFGVFSKGIETEHFEERNTLKETYFQGHYVRPFFCVFMKTEINVDLHNDILKLKYTNNYLGF